MGQAERAIPLVEALLALARPAVAPVDLYQTLRPVARLYGAVAHGGGGGLVLAPAPDPPVRSSAGGDAARLALATVLDALVQPGVRVRVAVRREGGAAVVGVAGTATALPPAETVRSALAALEIIMDTDGAAIIIRFPPPDGHD